METLPKCQLVELEHLSAGNAEPLWFLSPQRVLRSLTARMDLRFKRRVKALLRSPLKLFGRRQTVVREKQTAAAETGLQAGDSVRVRPLEEIRATLDVDGMLRGCGFMPEMGQYCGTVQRVYRPVRRFVDERDRLVKRSRGVVLLEGIHCQGTQEFGPCDRSCFYFWREEWLELVSRSA